jgi:hypothetical protein
METTHKCPLHHFVWAKEHYKPKTFSMGDYVLWFPKMNNSKLEKFKRQWFGPYHIQYCLPNNIALLVTVDKFDANPILVNINKVKLYRLFDGDSLESQLEGKKGPRIEELEDSTPKFSVFSELELEDTPAKLLPYKKSELVGTPSDFAIEFIFTKNSTSLFQFGRRRSSKYQKIGL